MIDLQSEVGAHIKKRLQEDEVIWFTTVNQKGVPISNPVWFYWDGEFIIVYSQPESYRVRNIAQNPNVSLHLQGVDPLGHNVVVLNGEAALLPYYRTMPSGYVQKYAKYLPEMGMTIDEMIAQYSVEIRVRPDRIRTG